MKPTDSSPVIYLEDLLSPQTDSHSLIIKFESGKALWPNGKPQKKEDLIALRANRNG
jgi:hypothetical protein